MCIRVTRLKRTEHHLPYEITQCYQPPNAGECTLLPWPKPGKPALDLPTRKGWKAELILVLSIYQDGLVICGRHPSFIVLTVDHAFDMVDHDILLQHLQMTFGIDDVAHQRIQSYLSDRMQHVRRGPNKSTMTRLACGVPQGSVLGPILKYILTNWESNLPPCDLSLTPCLAWNQK